jgi:DNA-3-methyladenine glycosylase I
MAALLRCPWSESTDIYRAYHDAEWGVPVRDDRTFFEFLLLEGAQAGLSWSTILNKREGYRSLFADFDPARVARFTPARIERILLDPSIVRHRGKIESAVGNAMAFLAVQREFGTFDSYVWRFVGGRPRINAFRTLADVPARTPESDQLSKDLKARGFRFVGSTIVYAFMQATGLVNDHLVDCPRWQALGGGRAPSARHQDRNASSVRDRKSRR